MTTNYIPSDHPQQLGVTRDNNSYYEKHLTEYKTFGPPPRNYYAARYKKNRSTPASMLYADHSTNNTIRDHRSGGSFAHPCSPQGLQAKGWHTFPQEFEVSRTPARGWFPPPLKYWPGQMIWNHHKDWMGALATAVRDHGINVSKEQVESRYNYVMQDPKMQAEQYHVLYHPGDRELAIFQDESSAALVARYGFGGKSFSLIIVCPYTRADGVGWNRIWDTENRPPIITRWSTGLQAQYPPIVLMCLPRPETNKGRESFTKPVEWFSMAVRDQTPLKTWFNTAQKQNNGLQDLMAVAKSFKFPDNVDPRFFNWVLVRVHRKIAFGTVVSDKDLGNYIFQYSKYTDHALKFGSGDFVFKPDNSYNGRNIDYQTLTWWLLSPKFSPFSSKFMAQWDCVHEAMINYNLNQTDIKWDAFRRNYEAARKYIA